MDRIWSEGEGVKEESEFLSEQLEKNGVVIDEVGMFRRSLVFLYFKFEKPM